MTSEEIIRKWLEDSAKGGAGWYYQHLLENGEAFHTLASQQQPQLRHFRMENKTQTMDCYANSQRFAQAYPGIKYYEGFRFAGVFFDEGQRLPMTPEIAWNVVDGNTVVEWTTRTDGDLCSPLYFGVALPVGFLERYMGKEIVPPMLSPNGRIVRAKLTLGTPLLGWYLKLKEEGMA